MRSIDAVTKATADGYTLLVATNTTHSANPSLYKRLPYDAVRDFTPIGRMTAGQFLLITHGSLGVKTVQELTALAKASPGKLSYATSNSTSLVSAEWFKALAGIDIVGVPYKSNPTALADVVAGRVPLMFAEVISQDSAAFGRFVGEQIQQWAQAIRAARIQPE